MVCHNNRCGIKSSTIIRNFVSRDRRSPISFSHRVFEVGGVGAFPLKPPRNTVLKLLQWICRLFVGGCGYYNQGY